MQDSKALAMLNLVDFRYKAESIKDTSYRKILDIGKFMINDNLSICYIGINSNNKNKYVEFREVDCSSKLIEISDIEKNSSLFKIYREESIN